MCFHADLLSPFFFFISSFFPSSSSHPFQTQILLYPKLYFANSCLDPLSIPFLSPKGSPTSRILCEHCFANPVLLLVFSVCHFLCYDRLSQTSRFLLLLYFSFFLRRSLSLDPVICVDSLIIISTTRFSSPVDHIIETHFLTSGRSHGSPWTLSLVGLHPFA